MPRARARSYGYRHANVHGKPRVISHAPLAFVRSPARILQDDGSRRRLYIRQISIPLRTRLPAPGSRAFHAALTRVVPPARAAPCAWETVAFGDVTVEDARNLTVGNSRKLIRLAQCQVEYLLHVQAGGAYTAVHS
jgi:hypothetical protein